MTPIAVNKKKKQSQFSSAHTNVHTNLIHSERVSGPSIRLLALLEQLFIHEDFLSFY